MSSKRKKEKANPKDLQQVFEKIIIKKKLKGFSPQASKAWKQLTMRYGPKISHNQLLSIAEVTSNYLQIPLYREYKRRKEMLIKWFDEQIDLIIPFLDYHFTIIDDNGNVF